MSDTHPLSDDQCQALRALPLPFHDMLRAAFDMGQKHGERGQHIVQAGLLDEFGKLGVRLMEIERERMAALRGADIEAREADHWKANHANMVARCALLSQRDDLPVDRLSAYRELVRLQELLAQRDAGPWTYHARPDAPEFVNRYFLESDSGPDVRLYINGNFGNDDERRVYGEALARQLNGGAP